MNKTHCPFASSARMWVAPKYNQKISLEDNVKLIVPVFAKFAKVARYELLDGFVIEIADHRAGDTIESLGKTLRSVLTYLSLNDPRALPRKNIMSQDINSVFWQYQFSNTTMFITTFAPCYPTSHPRYSFDIPSTFILFQAQNSLTI
eukprot:TRINITY_DN8977_c0_g1_i1.p1 TRINITY_DN8977_c0_g1~~TRINITY_DN8977_c0_g1_i1.p1  ORF type:complete len:147 (+),score=21.92 TRINITY_DN8977_c0_g1_i1:236-676(+)